MPELSRVCPAPSAALLLLAPAVARASFLSGEALDAAVDCLAITVLIVVPIVGIAVFWLVHVLSERQSRDR